ncbi:MAG: 50S ribosomal protein L34e [Pyrobaculum sp.]
MPRPALRTKSKRKVKVKTPGGRTVVHYEKKAKGVPKCPITKKPLGGMNMKVYRFGISIRAPSRPYGGFYSHKVLARALRIAVRS